MKTKTEINKQIGAALRAVRLERGLTLRTLSQKLGIVEPALCAKEKGRTAYHVYELGLIMKELVLSDEEMGEILWHKSE